MYYISVLRIFYTISSYHLPAICSNFNTFLNLFFCSILAFLLIFSKILSISNSLIFN